MELDQAGSGPGRHGIDLSAPGIAVIINAWQELDSKQQTSCCEQIISFLEARPNIHCLVLAATHFEITDLNQGPNHWYSNTKRLLHDEQGVDWIRRYWHYRPQDCFASANAMIRDHDWQGRACLALWEQWQLEYLLNHPYAMIQNVWYFGMGLGVRRDPLGWGQLCDLIKCGHVGAVNILMHKDCVLENLGDGKSYKDATFIEPEFCEKDWQNLGDDVYLRRSLEWMPA